MTVTAIDTVTGEIIDSLEAAEQVISDGLETFVRVGNTLMLIKENGWHRDAGYATLDDYCERRWGFSARQGQRLVAAASVMAELAEADEATNWSHLPTNESQTRPLQSLDAEERVEVWGEVNELAEEEGRAPTARDVDDVVTKRTRRSESTTTETVPTTAGEEGEATAPRAEPSEPDRPDNSDAIDEANKRIENSDVAYRESFSHALSKAGVLLRLDPERCAAVTLVEDRTSDEQFIKEARTWLDRFDKALHSNHLRSVQ